MRSFIHINARTVEEACAFLSKYKGKAVLNAGGTDLLSTLKGEYLFDYPEAIINIKTIQGLDFIKADGKGLRIGALAKLADVAKSPTVKEEYWLLAEAVMSVASPNVRNMATIGGNLAQDVRCWYYRYPRQIGGPIDCLRKGGKRCKALVGDNRYHSLFGATPLAEYPCSSHCPAHISIPSYLGHVKTGDLAEGAWRLMQYNPIPAVTGRVCPAFCEPRCNRGELDQPVAVRDIERGIGDYTLKNTGEFYAQPKAESGRRVAVVGSGPAGLSAAFYMRQAGHQVVVFERLPEAGGMLRYSIPGYRLSREVVRRQVRAFEAMGITFKVGTEVGKDVAVDELMRTFDVVFIATGAWKEKTLGVRGEEHSLSGLEFLNRVKAGSREVPGRRVAVIGGGNVAIDVARTLLRLGSKPVVVYRRTEGEMPALKEEARKAQEEGVKFEFLALPTQILKNESAIDLTCVRMKLGELDESGRHSPAPIPGSDFILSLDAVIKAIGEEPEMLLLPEEFRRDRYDLSSSFHVCKNLFVGGDCLTGPSTVIQAIASARDAVGGIESFFDTRQQFPHDDGTRRRFTDPSFDKAPRVQLFEQPLSERIRNVDIEDATGLGLGEIAKEAQRCLNCGCLAVCPSDVGVALIALDAYIVTNRRTVSAQEFFKGDATTCTILDPDELITEIWIPRLPAGTRQKYSKFTLRKPIDFAMVSVASVIIINDGICSDARIVLGAVAPEPIRAREAEEIIKGQHIDETIATEAAEAAVADAVPLRMNDYKIEVTKTLVKRAIMG